MYMKQNSAARKGLRRFGLIYAKLVTKASESR